MERRYGIIANLRKEEARVAAHELASLLSIPEHSIISSPLEVASRSEVVFSVGGDGTMLSAARAIMRVNPDAELIGVNLGKMGFLAENPPGELPDIVNELHQGALRREERSLLRAMVTSESESGIVFNKNNSIEEITNDTIGELTALNEFVIDNFGSTRMLTLEITIDGAPLGTLRADGLIVATPTGSTGYSLSVGGPIVEPTSPVHIMTAIAPHSLTVRPLVFSNTTDIVIGVTSETNTQTLIVADGQEEVIVETPARISISKYPNSLHLLRRKSHSYFDLLRTKLLWSADVRERGKGRW